MRRRRWRDWVPFVEWGSDLTLTCHILHRRQRWTFTGISWGRFAFGVIRQRILSEAERPKDPEF